MAKIVRFFDGDVVRYGELKGEQVFPLDGEIGTLSPSKDPPVRLDQVRLEAPATPRQVVAIGPGYIATMQGHPPPPRPTYWIKPAGTVLRPGGTIELPPDAPMVVHESELAIVIGKTAKNVPPERCAEHVFGYTCINDVTAGLMLQREEFMRSQYSMDGKIYDTFAPLGPLIVTDLDTNDLRIQCRVNGKIVQDHRTTDRVWSLMEVVSLVSFVLTLYPGDVIATGSPPGYGPLEDGDIVEVEIDGIGVLRNPVRTKASQ